MAISDQDKYNAMQMLANGKSATEIAKELDLSTSIVYRFKRELDEAKENGGIDTLIDLDRVVLGEVIESVKENHPTLAESAEQLSSGVLSAQRLSEEMHATARHLTTRVKFMAASADTSSELLILSEVLCNLQNAFFNNKTTQVNVQNNYGGQSGYSEFLSDEPAQ